MTPPDPLANGDAAAASAHAHLEALLRCWLRETGLEATAGPLTVSLRRSGLALATEVTHRSPTDWHRFGAVRLIRADGVDVGPVDPVLAVALLADEAARLGWDDESARQAATSVPPAVADEVADLVGRTAESLTRVARYLDVRRRQDAEGEHEEDGFLAAEQALLLGHLRHPAPKSRDGLSAAEDERYAPELRGGFALHWFEADPTVVSHDAAIDGPGMLGRDTPALFAELSGLAADSDRVLLPAHPWQARDLLHRPRIQALLAAGTLRDRGVAGPRWRPTSSLRTVYLPGETVMLKLSLGLRLTNSRREFTRTELLRGLEVQRLLACGLADATFAAHPDFRVLRDPAWAALDEPARAGGPAVSGLEAAVRESPVDITEFRCLAGLVAPRPGLGRSMLGEIVAASDGPNSAAAAEWTADYVDRVLVPMLHLYAATGIGLEGHQQNTLVRLDPDGRVAGGAFRDNQGYYLAASRLPDLLRVSRASASTLAVVDDPVVDERLSYYLLRNQALAVVGALGVDGLADERELLGVLADRLRAALPGLAEAGPDGDRLARRWLDADTLPCKANMLTRLKGIDEVLAPLDNQSVYLRAPNPLAESRLGASR
ncbi:siderophore synthetase component [Actinoalloteichus hoggarensis]|uniref:N(2)-citryl-N(6)-acetyl-N(6)-hydroxylysine synthase n=1 Tax=Actinoalloteichus hoggarensis TaxID=1470176 RepID=A0A221W270_9PSEU|nr:IucA/IucC family protein [Actinoalloteichus hoggarensis]ASO19910.1 N(2)-citryl-N(6)-acetyl-N(6)-hydroxylysine synthase [Actinoalloteichus hoggarensis]MBB5919381.1 siderophore synthetase component [Actinoalloteichus hoggarensis]